MPELNKNCPHVNPGCTNGLGRPNCWQCTKNPDFDKLPKCKECGQPVMSDGIKLCPDCTRKWSRYTDVVQISPKLGALALEEIQPTVQKYTVSPEFIAARAEYAEKKKESENESKSKIE